MSASAVQGAIIPAKKAEHFETLEKQQHAGRFGMWVFIATELLFFSALFTLYIAYRSLHRESFAIAASYSDVVIGTVNTFVLITSSLTMALAIHAARSDQRKWIFRYLVITLSLGVVFVILKSTEYWLHIKEGIGPGTLYTFTEHTGPGIRTYFGLYYVTTGVHTVHVLIGLGLLIALIIRARRGYYHAGSTMGVELIGVYWHLVDLIWIFVWPLYYLIR